MRLAEDFSANGADAIKRCREEKPEAYIKAIAALCPKEIELRRPLEDMATEELIAALDALTGFLAGQGAGQRDPDAESPEPAH